MPLQKQPINVTLRGLQQHTGVKMLQPGQSPLMQNVRQRYGRGVYGKRYGHSLLTTSVDVGALFYALGLATVNGDLCLRTSDAAYLYDTATSTWRYRGSCSRAVVSVAPALITPGNAWKPVQISAGGYTYFFAGVAPQTAPTWTHQQTPLAYVYRIVDANGAEIVPETTISGATGVTAKPVVAGGFVWLFLGCDTASGTGNGYRKLYAVKLDPANPTTAPVVTTYQDAGASEAICTFDVMQLAAGGAAVACGRYNQNLGQSTLDLSLLNTATGQPQASPGIVSTVVASIGYDPAANHDWNLQFLKNGNPDGNGKYYLVAYNGTNWYGVTVTASTLVAATPVALTGVTGTVGAAFLLAGSPMILTSTPGTTPSLGTVQSTVFSTSWAVTFAAAIIKRHAVVCGEPIVVDPGGGGTASTGFYIPILYDDADVSTPTAQRCYGLLDIFGGNSVTPFGSIVGRALYGLGGDTYQHAFVGSITNKGQSWVAPFQRTDQTLAKVQFAVNSYDGAVYTAKSITFDFTKSLATGLGPPATTMLGKAAILPGTLPGYLAGAAVAEWPSLYPPSITATTFAPGTGFVMPAGTYSLQACYVYRDRVAGNVIRSAFSPVVTVTCNGSTQAIEVLVPSLALTSTAAGTFGIEVYLSVAGSTTLFLQPVLPNDPTVDSIEFDFNTGGANRTATGQCIIPVTGTEIPYTASGELPNDPPPPCRVVASWRDRVFIADSEADGEIWPSKEIVAGKGPEFSEGLLFSLPGGTGPVTAMCPLDHNWFLIFQADSIWAIQGDGPDETGNGAYEPLRIIGNRGTTAPGSVVSTSRGVFFQDANGRICLVDGSLTVQDAAGDGPWSYTGVVTAAVDLPAKRETHFYLAGAAADGSFRLVLDWGNPSPDSPLGEWYSDTQPLAPTTMLGDGGATAYNGQVALAHSASPALVRTGVDGQFFDDASNYINRKIQLPLILSGIRGYERIYRGQIVGQYKSQHTLSVTVDTFDGVAGETGSATETFTKVVSAGPELFELRPTRQRLSIFTLTIADSGTDTGEGGTLDGLALEVGVKGGLPRINTGQRF